MKISKLVIPSALLAFSLVSCQNSGIKRVVYPNCEFANALAAHQKIKANQKKDETTTLFDHGSIAYNHTLVAKGTVRLDGLSFREIDLNLATNYTLSWTLSNQFFKVVGNKETLRYVYDDTTKAYWLLDDYYCEDKEYHDKTNLTKNGEMAKYDNSFADFVEDYINFYTTLSVPAIMNITLGITGEQYEYSSLFPITAKYCTDYFFNEENHTKIEELIKYYKDKNEGYNLAVQYGLNDDNATCISLNGKVNVNDFHDTKYMTGYLNVDGFSSYKNNFISQMEVKASGRVTNARKINLDTYLDLYVGEQVNQNECQREEYDLTKYRDITDE